MRYLLRTFGIAFLLLLGGPPTADAQVPSRPPTHVVDLARILSPEDAQVLRGKLELLEAKSTAQIVILTVKTLKGEDPFWYSLKIARQWKLGIGQKSNGILIFHAVDERRTFVQVGKHLEDRLPDSALDIILNESAVPHLKKSEYGVAFNALVDKISMILSGEELPEQTAERQSVEREVLAFGLFIVAFILLCIANWIHIVLGGAVGAGSFAGVAWLIALSNPAIIVAGVIGLILGLAIHIIRDVPWCGGGCGDMAGSVAQGAGDFLGAAAGAAS